METNIERTWTLGLSKKTENILVKAGFSNKHDVINTPAGDLLKIPSLGRKRLREITQWATNIT